MVKSALVAGIVVTVLVALATQHFLEERLPPLPETWKVKVIDGAMRLYKHLITAAVSLGLTSPLSPFDREMAVRAVVLQVTGWPWISPHSPRLKVTDTVFGGVSVRVYEPTNSLTDEQRPAILYMHGGVWSVLSVDSHDAFTAQLALRANVVVISIEYRLSPEHPYPAGLDDVLSVLRHVRSRGPELRVDPARVAVGGDSCGGNMAAAIALRAPGELAMQILLVPVLQLLTLRTPSWTENAAFMPGGVNDKGVVALALAYGSLSPALQPDVIEDRHTMTSLDQMAYVDTNRWLDPSVVRSPELKGRKLPTSAFNATLWNKLKHRFMDPFFMPLMADDVMLRDAPHAYVMTAGYDIIRDDGAMFASRLTSVGVKAELRNYPTAFHHALLFHQGPLQLQVAEDILGDLASYVKKHL